MFSKLSFIICNHLINHHKLQNEDKELYTYGFFLVLSSSFFGLIVFLFGLLFSCLFKALVFYISFRVIRIFAGGYHADTEMRCEFLTTLSFLAATFLISISEKPIIQIIALVGAFLSIIAIAIFAPLDTPAKPLDEDEKRKYRRISLIILSVIVSVIIVSLLFHIQLLLVPCCLSLVLEGILLVAGKIKGHLIASE